MSEHGNDKFELDKVTTPLCLNNENRELPPNNRPRVRRKYIVAAGIVGLIIIIILLGYFTGVFKRIDKYDFDEKYLKPPNPTKKLPSSPSTLHVFEKAAVCADGPPCAEIGRNILKKNGSAVDATLAAMFCNGVVTMQSMGIGGGFQMTIYIKEDGKAYSLNARETAPMNTKLTMYKDDKMTSQNGPLAIAVPGELRGYKAAHDRFGTLPWNELIEPTIDLCEKGYIMSAHQHDSLHKTKLHDDPNLREWFRNEDGTFKKPGTKIIPTQLCKTLRLIAESGADDFYNGTISKLLLEDIRDIGGIITSQDLENYKPQWMEPVSINFQNGDNLYSAPPPGSGILLGFILNILDGYNMTRDSIDGLNNTILTYHRIIEAFKYAYARRTELGDTNFINITELLQNLTSKEYANSVRMKIKDNSTSLNPKDYGAVYYNQGDHGTAHISVLAENGDAVSVTSSINIYYGAGLTSKQTGVILNSVMDDFSFPYFKNFFGLPGSPNNQMVPGKRPLSSMSPSIVVDKNGDVKMVVGGAGGTKITTAVALTIMRALWFGENIKEAVDEPRIHHQLFPMVVEYEYGTLQQIVDGLKALGHKVRRNAGSVICSLMKTAGKIMANADYRKGGDVYGT